jgi:fumarate hydratase subunit alpha
MREILPSVITEAVKTITIDASTNLEPDILGALVAARDRETSPLAKNILNILMVNADIASREKIPVCQDTGVAVVFAEVGQEVHVAGDLEDAIQEGIRAGYEEGHLRKSICDPVTRENTGTNTPAVVHFEFVPGDSIKISMLPKGCGSENMSGLVMLPPSAGIKGMVDFVVSQVVKAGSNPCPPVVVGVGMGGTFEKAALLAKKSLFRSLGKPAQREDIAELETEILKQVNEQGSGAEGLGGCNTALAVHVEAFPSHIASLPVAVNIQCHAHRHKEVII